MKTLLKRMYAGLIDAFVIAVPVWFIYHTFIDQSMADKTFKISYAQLNFNITTATMMFLFIYYIVCEIIGQSIGKKIFNIKIKYKGKGIFAKIIRPFVKLITVYFPYLGIVSLFLPEYKLYYDFLAGTNIEEIQPDISRSSLK